jgi:rubredoxin
MSERALRGTRLGATSYETDDGIDLAPRQNIEYLCPNGHRFRMPFSMEADVPAGWECRVCGAQAVRVDGDAPEEKAGKPARTHWDMLLERRSLPELEDVLAERLEVLRSGGIGFATAMAPIDDRRSGPDGADSQSGSGVLTATRPAVAAAGRTAKKTTATKKPAPKKTVTAVRAAPESRAAARPTRTAPPAKTAAGAKQRSVS